MDGHILLQLIVNGILVGGVYALMSLGINLVWGVMEVVNLAHGDLIMTAGFLTFWLFTRLNLNPLLVLPLAMALTATVGILAQRYLLGRLPRDRGAVKTSLLMTFGISYVVINTAQLIWGNEFHTVDSLAGSWTLGGLAFARGRTVAFLMAGVITLLLWVFLRHTDTGKAVRAVTQNPDGATVCGIDIARVRAISFGLGTALAGAAGSLMVTIFAISPAMGTGYTIRSFAVTAIGGMGSFPGALLGAIILGLAEVFTGYLASAQIAGGVAFLLFLAVLLARPQGLLGGKRL